MKGSTAGQTALTALSVLAMVGAWALARPGDAEARADLIAGSPRISTIRAFVPARGRDAGRMVVWVRVGHAPGTRRALARERPETVHTGRVVVRVGDTSRFATEQLDLDGRRLLHGYHLRFPRGAVQAARVAPPIAFGCRRARRRGSTSTRTATARIARWPPPRVACPWRADDLDRAARRPVPEHPRRLAGRGRRARDRLRLPVRCPVTVRRRAGRHRIRADRPADRPVQLCRYAPGVGPARHGYRAGRLSRQHVPGAAGQPQPGGLHLSGPAQQLQLLERAVGRSTRPGGRPGPVGEPNCGLCAAAGRRGGRYARRADPR